MTEALRVGPRMKVLEIGTGSGYQAAVLAKLRRRVYSIERFKPLSKEAERLLISLGIYNVVCDVATAARAGRPRRRSTASSSPPPPRSGRRR
jgi:protein-L-isoaspartate(D-aspartate) O-methyltransferase